MSRQRVLVDAPTRRNLPAEDGLLKLILQHARQRARAQNRQIVHATLPRPATQIARLRPELQIVNNLQKTRPDDFGGQRKAGGEGGFGIVGRGMACDLD